VAVAVHAHARVFWALTRVGFASLSAYRAQVVIWFLTTTMPLIMFALWSTVARQGAVGRFDEGVFASYFVSTLVVRQLSSAWVVWELNENIRTGKLSTALLRPVHPLLFYAGENLGAMPFRLVVLVPVVAAALWLIDGISISTEVAHVFAFFWTTLAALALNFLIQACNGLLAIYTERSLALQDAFFGIWAVLGGYLIPLELMPAVQSVANWLPFRAMGSLPTEIILGHLDGPELLQGVSTQLAWMVGVGLLLAWLWRRAMVHFEAYGN